MLIFAIYAVRFNEFKTRVTNVLWQELSGLDTFEYKPIEASLSEVTEVLASENKVYLFLQSEFGEWINSDSEFQPLMYPEGEIGIYVIGYELIDLPSF